MSKPLAERMRPRIFDDYFGQEHLVAQGAILRTMIENNKLQSFILWGAPGVGKTTLANIIAEYLDVEFYTLSAVTGGIKEVRDIIMQAKLFFQNTKKTPILFIDEIHRFSKSQQDSLLGAVEQGDIILIGATTENPSFEIIRPLLSRCQLYVLKSLDKEDLLKILNNAISKDQILKQQDIHVDESDALLHYSGGDARKLLNLLELVINFDTEKEKHITNAKVVKCLQQKAVAYDKQGEIHYDVISAFIKSVRGSDPDAAIYWLARMLEGGEDPKFIARRLVILAAEDIGLANPNALLIANTAFDIVNKIGLPEGRIPLAEATIYLATSPKSNSAYLAIDSALQYVKKNGDQSVPLHLRNAPTKLMKELGYHDGYKYPHDYKNNFVKLNYFPDKINDLRFWKPQDNAQENKMKEKMEFLWERKYE